MKRAWKYIGLVTISVVRVCLIVLLIAFVVVPWAKETKKQNDAQKLIKAIEDENVSKVESLLEQGVNPNWLTARPSIIWTMLETAPRRPICVACNVGNLEIVELLIEYGATAQPMEECGFSPLRETVFFYHPDDLEIVKLLLNNGARQYDESYKDSIMAAAEMIPSIYTNETLEGYDAETGKGITEIVRLLLEERSVDDTYELGRTLLICAARSGNIYLVEYLLSSGADRDVKDVLGKTAMDYAKEEGHKEVIDLLSQYPKEVE